MNPYEEKGTGLNRLETEENQETGGRENLNRYIGYSVADKTENKIGTLECLWSDHTGQPAFLGVKTGWFLGKTHVVPANAAEVNERSGIIRLPYPEDMIKGAPVYDADMTLDEATEREIYGYYHEDSGMEERPRFNTGLEREASAPKPEGTEETRIPLHEEEVKIGKRRVEAGGIRLRKIVRTETVNQPVELEREEIVVERVPASEGRATTGEAFAEQDVFIPLRREEPVVQKESHVREEVRAHKQTEVERQQVSETVHKEDVEVEKQGEETNLKDRK